MMRKRFSFLGILAISIGIWIQTTPMTLAQGGGQTDEECEAIVEAAVLAYESRVPYDNPDCIYAPGTGTLAMQAASVAGIQNPTQNQVRAIALEDDILYARKYRRLQGDVSIYNTPDGTIVGSVQAADFIMVSVGAVLQNWVQIGTDQWVRIEDTVDSPPSDFTGVEILAPLDYPIAWMADWNPRTRLYPSDYPGGPMNENLPRIYHHQLLTIYATEVVDGYEWYMIAPQQWVRQTYVAKVLPVERPDGVNESDRWVAIDLYEQTAVAYEGNRMVFATLVSSGRDGYATNTGLYQIYQRHASTRMTSASGLTNTYFIERVPWVMYFDGDIALHGAYWHDRFGYRTSAGCVNLTIMDSYWFYNWTASVPDGAAYVYVYSTGVYGGNVPEWARPLIGHNNQ